jgi:hypothetical protein
VLGKQEQGESQGRVTQAELNQRQDQNAIANYIAQQNAQTSAANTDLQRKQFEGTNRSGTAKQALIGALLGGGITPTSISGGKASGGFLQSMNANPDALNAMKTLGTQGAGAQASPLEFQGGLMVKPPELTPMQPVNNNGFLSTLARILQIGGAAGSAMGGLGKPKPQEQPMDERYGMPGGQY